MYPSSKLQCHKDQVIAYQATGDWEKALQHLYEILRLDPHQPDAYNSIGCLLYKQKRFLEALPYFEKSLRLNPNSGDAHYNLANTLVEHNQTERAMAHYKEVLRLDPTHGSAGLNLGLLLFSEGHSQEALDYLSQDIALHPDHPDHSEAHFHLSQLYLESGEIALSLNALEQTLKLNPRHAQALHNLAVLSLRQQDKPRAILHFEKALSLDPDNATARHMLTALQGQETPFKAPASYVAALFDQYAAHYTAHVKHKLGYEVPFYLRQAVGQSLGTSAPAQRILDLGCGTGLCGIYFRDLASTLVGVDLSQQMVDKATDLGAYDQLILSDIESYLAAPIAEPFQLIIAADVFVYLGDLANLFRLVVHQLAPAGRFAFTIETTHAKAYQLETTGRFSHNPDYIKALSEQCELEIEREEEIPLRQYEGKQLIGKLYVLKKVFNKTSGF